jgi:dolichyl-phosphate-mannose--protein O-mannosyl transferase
LEKIMLSLFSIRAAAVLLAGMYAMRTAYGPMEGKLPPLTFLAATIFLFCIFIFHRVPNSLGWWAYVVLIGSVVGCGVNVVFFRAGPALSMDGIISFFSAICWVVVGVVLGLSLIGNSGNTQ